MKSIKIAGLALASMLLVGMALAGNAAAGPLLWLLCLKGSNVNNTKYEDSSCSKAKSTGEWEAVSLGTRTDTIRILGFTILLLDHHATGGQSGVRCGMPTAGWGVVEPNGKVITTKLEVESPKTECERVEGGCKAGEVEKLKAIDLPWKSEIVETEHMFLGKVEADGNGEPGWEVECNTLLGKVADKCTSEAASEPEEYLGNNELVGGVLLTFFFFLHRRDGKCSQGGAKSALVLGFFAYLLASGGGLSIDP